MKIAPLSKMILLKQLKQFFLLAVTVTVLLGITVACHDKTNNQDASPCGVNPGSCKSVLEAKDFFLFKVGSFWVYEEETSHERDSMYVTDYANSETGYDFDVRIKSSLTDYVYHYWPTFTGWLTGCNQTGPIAKRCLYVNRSKSKFQDDLGESQVFFINYKLGDFETTGGDMDYCPNSIITIGDVLSTYHTDLEDFSTVVRIDESCSSQEGKQPAHIYYSKNIGIIRKELIDSTQVWNLVNYHVIQ